MSFLVINAGCPFDIHVNNVHDVQGSEKCSLFVSNPC